ncbi:MAG: N-acetyl-gamma-glutamyl-phosphate reductase [Candidatus Omnitrophica bacterium]|nr:N-acetyl-gamma-glutamyl-phosphate reductase [Candidatus Omnitrophota bacterium]
MVKVGIVGVTGYTGQELVRILLKHPKVKITGLFSSSAYNKPVKEVLPEFASGLNLICNKPDIKDISGKCDIVFLALPHTASMEIAPGLIKAGVKVIDLSADYRLKDLRIYSKFYAVKHKDPSGVKAAIYGLPELYRKEIKKARLAANPGCYPTPAILSLAPLIFAQLIDTSAIIIDAKSGVSGAGKKKAEEFFLEPGAVQDFKAYKVGVHQHTPEIDQELSNIGNKRIKVAFVPHLLPINRGILETIYVKKNNIGIGRGKGKGKGIAGLYKEFYKKEPFIRIKKEGEFPALKDVAHTNFCDIGIRDEDDKVIIVSAIDNLLKGASGQAVQNMNIMCGFTETLGLR